METTPAPTPETMSYPEAAIRMQAGASVRREKWPEDFALNIKEGITMITQPPRTVPIALHALDLSAIDWIEIK